MEESPRKEYFTPQSISSYVIAALCIAVTFQMYFIYESTHEIIVVPVGLVTFTIGTYIIVGQIEFLKHYRDMIIPFIVGMIMPNLAIHNNEIQPIILFDVLVLLGIISFLLEGVTEVRYDSFLSDVTINLSDGRGLEVFTIYGALGLILLLGLIIIAYQVYRRHQ